MIEEEDATMFQAEELAAFAKERLFGTARVYAVRDAHYYQTRVLEQQSENGGIRILKKTESWWGSTAMQRGNLRSFRTADPSGI